MKDTPQHTQDELMDTISNPMEAVREKLNLLYTQHNKPSSIYEIRHRLEQQIEEATQYFINFQDEIAREASELKKMGTLFITSSDKNPDDQTLQTANSWSSSFPWGGSEIDPKDEEILYRQLGILDSKDSLINLTLKENHQILPSRVSETLKAGSGIDRFTIHRLDDNAEMTGGMDYSHTDRIEQYVRLPHSDNWFILTRNLRDKTAPQYSTRIEFSIDTVKALAPVKTI